MHIKFKIFIFSLMLLGIQQNAAAQRFYENKEYGFSLGAAQYMGDLNPEYGFKFIRPSGGVFFRSYLNPYIAVRAGLNFTSIGYDDKLSKNEYQKVRNLSFRNNIIDFTVMGEFNFFYYETGNVDHRFTPYIALGIGALYSNPYAKYRGRNQSLRPLGTEGQNLATFADRKYSNINIVIPVGFGIKYWLKPGMNLGVEVIHNIATGDYLDDVSQTYVGLDKFVTNNNPTKSTAAILQDPSLTTNGNALGRAGKQRGDNSTTDQYLTARVTLSLQLKTYKCPSYRGLFWN